MKPVLISSIEEFKKIRASLTGSVGFVPTMGALHLGHMELIKQSCMENNSTVCSIFVNPTQFNSTEDLEKYPKTLAQDLELLKSKNVDYVFTPQYEDIYQDNYRFKIEEKEFSKKFCGEFRPGHFDGVLTVVMKLFNIVQPSRAYFGEKDFQQLTLIQDMVKAFFMNLEVVPVKTVRDSKGLALSSRNTRLSNAGIEKAQVFAKILKNSIDLDTARMQLQENQIEVEYLQEHQGRRLAAVWIEGVRLIDNV
jgi:pantoate--beta-alanine ligase